VESASSKSLIVRWEPPPPESQNGIITGYKLRWRKAKGGEPEVVTTDGSRRLFAITGLKNGKEYQVKHLMKKLYFHPTLFSVLSKIKCSTYL
jgi:neogenin